MDIIFIIHYWKDPEYDPERILKYGSLLKVLSLSDMNSHTNILAATLGLEQSPFSLGKGQPPPDEQDMLSELDAITGLLRTRKHPSKWW